LGRVFTRRYFYEGNKPGQAGYVKKFDKLVVHS
jgi:hypothetical protein